MDKQVIDGYYAAPPEVLQKFWQNGGVIDGIHYPLAKTFLHTHTDMGSPKDSILTIGEYMDFAKKMGARSVSITDHAYLYGVVPLYKACENYNAEKKEDEQPIKCIIGVEFYVCDTVEDKAKKKHTRLHLIAYAKDEIGYHVLCRLATASNERILTAGDNNYPCVSKKLLQEYIGPGSKGHDHIILTSACIGGVVAGIMYESENEKKNIALYTEKVNNLTKLRDAVQFQYRKQQGIAEQIAALQPIAAKKYGKRQNMLKKNPDEVALAQLEKEMQETTTATTQIKTLKAASKEVDKIITELKNQIKAHIPTKQENSNIDLFSLGQLSPEELADTLLDSFDKAIKESQKDVVEESCVREAFKKEMLYYEELAGKGNWFIEMQYHGVPNEKKYMHLLAELANELNMPLVAANDAHMSTRDKVNARKIVNGMRFNSKGSRWQDPTPDEEEMYLKTDAELYQWLCMELSEKDAMAAMMGREIIVDACNVKLTFDKHYPKFPIED